MATLMKEALALLAEARTVAATTSPLLAELRRDPSLILSRSGLTPDRWQTAALRSGSDRQLWLACRQGGKSQTGAALAARAALLEAPALVLIVSRSQRQSAELFKDKFVPLYNALGRPVPVVQQSALSMELANGSRIVCLPGKEETVRCYSGVRLLILDEAARVPDALYRSLRPMLAVSGGRLVALSTPWGRLGWFFEAWTGKARWERVKITAEQCPRITPEFLAEERAELGEHWYAQEYMVEFRDTIDAFFRQQDIEAAFTDGGAALDLGL